MGSTSNIPINLDPDLYSDGYKDPFIQDEDKLTISQLIPRILVERGSFLNITEDSLREEIQNQSYNEKSNTSSPDAEEVTNNEINSPPEEASTDVDDPLEVFQKQKADLSRNILTALNEISLSLDFVSLLISSVKPNIAKTTISPHLSKNVPLGSLNASRLSTSGEDGNPEKSSDLVKLSTKIGEGWKNESLNKITTLFQKSSKDLGEQVAKERTYWNMINKVRNNDEILFRTRDPANGSRAIGIKYGYGDSGSNFHDKGLAILRKDNSTGEITFNPLVSSGNRIQTKVYKFIRVKILSEIDGDFMLTGQSVFDPKKIGSRFSSNNEGGILEDIEKARFFLFEEDLFYQLLREAKQLINYNVSIISNKIIIEINNEIIEIESVIYDENNEDDLTNNYQNINDFSSMNNQKCQLILNYLKLMLCCYYQYNLNLKQKIPTAFTKRKQLNSHPLILRPMVGNIRYELNIKIANEILTRLIAKYNSKLDITYDLKKYVNLEASPTSNPFQKATERPVSTVGVVLKNKTNDSVMKIHIELTTNEIFMNLILNLNIIKFSTIDDLEKNLNGLNILQMSYNDFNDFEECLDWSILRFIS